jgi:hypothetical protein
MTNMTGLIFDNQENWFTRGGFDICGKVMLSLNISIIFVLLGSFWKAPTLKKVESCVSAEEFSRVEQNIP